MEQDMLSDIYDKVQTYFGTRTTNILRPLQILAEILHNFTLFFLYDKTLTPQSKQIYLLVSIVAHNIFVIANIIMSIVINLMYFITVLD